MLDACTRLWAFYRAFKKCYVLGRFESDDSGDSTSWDVLGISDDFENILFFVELSRDFPDVANKVYLIKSFGTSTVQVDICDPFGGSLNEYRTIRDEIDRALADLILFIREQGE